MLIIATGFLLTLLGALHLVLYQPPVHPVPGDRNWDIGVWIWPSELLSISHCRIVAKSFGYITLYIYCFLFVVLFGSLKGSFRRRYRNVKLTHEPQENSCKSAACFPPGYRAPVLTTGIF